MTNNLKNFVINISMVLLIMPNQFTFAGWFSPDSYEECVLDRMESQKTRNVIVEARTLCRKQFPLPPMPIDCSKYQTVEPPKQVTKKSSIQLNPYAFGINPNKPSDGLFIPENVSIIPTECQ